MLSASDLVSRYYLSHQLGPSTGPIFFSHSPPCDAFRTNFEPVRAIVALLPDQRLIFKTRNKYFVNKTNIGVSKKTHLNRFSDIVNLVDVSRRRNMPFEADVDCCLPVLFPTSGGCGVSLLNAFVGLGMKFRL